MEINRTLTQYSSPLSEPMKFGLLVDSIRTSFKGGRLSDFVTLLESVLELSRETTTTPELRTWNRSRLLSAEDSLGKLLGLVSVIY